MFPYRFDTSEPTDQSSTQPTSTLAPAPRRKRRVGTAALVALALSGGAVGGGAAGTVAALRWLAPQQSNGPIIMAQPAVAQTQAQTNVAGAVFNAVNPSVVDVIISAQARNGLVPTGNGSGFVVDGSGLILTNNHVVADTQNVRVRFSTGEERDAQIVGTDSSNDLALLKVDLPANVPAVTLGNSDSVQVGETAIAIGSPFGLAQTVTQGIISAVDRDWAPQGQIMRNLIQTDAPINPGNSGGPLLNANGEVIGINTLIESPVRGSVGVGFAVPINVAKQVLPQLQAGAKLEQGYLGVTIDQAQSNTNGVTIGDVDASSGAAEAGLKAGDVLTAVDGKAVSDYEGLVEQISGRQPGESVTVTITRNGQQQDVKVTLRARPAQPTE